MMFINFVCVSQYLRVKPELNGFQLPQPRKGPGFLERYPILEDSSSQRVNFNLWWAGYIYIYINICHIWTLLSKQTTDFFLTFTYGEFDGMKHCWLHLYFVLYTSVVSWICATYVHSGASQSPVVANKMTFYMQTNMPWSVWTKQTLFQVFLVAEWLKKKRVVKTIELGEIPLSNRTSVQRIRIVIIKFIKNN